jgi:hypothetical protein
VRRALEGPRQPDAHEHRLAGRSDRGITGSQHTHQDLAGALAERRGREVSPVAALVLDEGARHREHADAQLEPVAIGRGLEEGALGEEGDRIEAHVGRSRRDDAAVEAARIVARFGDAGARRDRDGVAEPSRPVIEEHLVRDAEALGGRGQRRRGVRALEVAM